MKVDQTEKEHDGYARDQNRFVKFALLFCCVSLLLSFSRFGFDAERTQKSYVPSQHIEISFISNHGAAYRKINIRSGPGVNYKVIREVDRGQLVIGIKRVSDANGDPWVRLKAGGYAKETILTRVGGR